MNRRDVLTQHEARNAGFVMPWCACAASWWLADSLVVQIFFQEWEFIENLDTDGWMGQNLEDEEEEKEGRFCTEEDSKVLVF